MGFGANKTLVEVNKAGAFGGNYFRNIYYSVAGKRYKNHGKNFDQLKDIDRNFYCSDSYDISVNIYGVKCGTSPGFWENKGCINDIDPYGWFQWYFRYWLVGDRRMMKDKLINRKKL